MAFLGAWKANETLTLYLQTVNPDTGAAWNADTFPTFRVYHLPTGTPIATGTYARQDIPNTTGFYLATVALTPAVGFMNGQMYGVRTAVTIVGMTGAYEDHFQIHGDPRPVVGARFAWRAQPATSRRLVPIIPARMAWQPQGIAGPGQGTAIAHIQTKGTDSGVVTGANIAFIAPITLGSAIIIAARIGDKTKTVTGITDTLGNQYFLARRHAIPSPGAGETLEIWYALNSPAGANTVAITLSASALLYTAFHEYRGILRADALDQVNSADGSSASPDSGTITTNQADELIIGAMSNDGNLTITPGAGYTSRGIVSQRFMTEERIVSTLVTTSASFGMNITGYWGCAVASFRGAAQPFPPARLAWHAQPLLLPGNTYSVLPARLAWQPHPMVLETHFPFRETTPALDTQTNLAAFLAAVSQNVIIAEAWLIQSQRLGLRLSFGYAPDASWEHRILDMSDIEITVAPGGGLATAANVSFTVAETGEGQSMLQLWHRFATIGGKADITIDFHLATGVTFRMFTGLIDTITVQNGRSQVLCVDESIQRNLQLPQRLVTPDAYPLAASGALTQPVPLVYGQGSHLQAAPLLFTNTSALAYTAAAHPMTLTSALAVFNADAVRYMPGNVPTTGDGTAATVFLQTPLQQTLLNTQTGPLAIFTQENVTNAAYVLDGNDATIATIGTTTLASNLDGQGFLGIIATPTSNQQGNNQAVITLTNHRRSVNSDPTVTGQFLVQTVIPATGQVLRSALFTTQNFRHSLNPQTTQQTIPNLTLGAQEAVEVLLLVRNEGGPGLGNNYYEVGGISIQTGYLPQGDTFPIFLYQGFDGRRDATGLVTQVVNTLYTMPSHVIGSLLADELGLTLSTTFPLAHTFYTNASYLFDGGLGYSWFVTRAPVRQILDDAARQAIGILSPDLVGQWNIRPFQSASPLHFAFTPYNILCVAGAEDATASDSLVLTLGNMANVHCRFEVHYRWNVGAQKFDGLMSATETGTTALGRDDLRLMCQLSALRYGVTETLIIQAYWITDTTTAMQLLAHLVRYFSFQRLTVTFDTTFQALSLQLGDFISVTHPLLPVGDTGGAFEVHTMRTAPVAGRVTLTCSKIAAVFLEYFTIRDQNGVVWYFWFDTAGDLARDTVPPAIFPFQNTDLTGSSIPWWHQVSDPLGGTWFLWPDVDGALTIDSAPPAFGLGLVTGLGQTAVALNTHTYRLGAGAAQEITIEDLG